jgi:hypothetical protein
MNKVCPLMLVGKKANEITLAPGIAIGVYECIGEICAAYRRDRCGKGYCGLCQK